MLVNKTINLVIVLYNMTSLCGRVSYTDNALTIKATIFNK